MSTPGSLSAGLAYLPRLLDACPDVAAFDDLVTGLVRAAGWHSASVTWAESPRPADFLARPDGVIHGPHTFDPDNTLGNALTPPGCAGAFWVAREPLTQWTDDDSHFLELTARLLERSPALSVLLGPTLDPERLSQRLADAAVIAGRMAHEFDNILTGVIGFSDLSLPLLPAGSQAAKYSGEISKASQRGVLFTQQLHELSRSGYAKPQPGSVPVALATQATRLAAVAPAVELASDIAPDLAGVAMEAGPLGVVLGHLLANAAEAMPAGGRIHVAADMIDLDEFEAVRHLGAARPGRHVRLTVRDAGSGIKPEVRAKLFHEPFFTTKVRHRGLGLAVVYRSLCAHRGGIRIEQTPAAEAGTTVRVVLPPAAPRTPATPVAPRTPAIPLRK